MEFNKDTALDMLTNRPYFHHNQIWYNNSKDKALVEPYSSLKANRVYLFKNVDSKWTVEHAFINNQGNGKLNPVYSSCLSKDGKTVNTIYGKEYGHDSIDLLLVRSVNEDGIWKDNDPLFLGTYEGKLKVYTSTDTLGEKLALFIHNEKDKSNKLRLYNGLLSVMDHDKNDIPYIPSSYNPLRMSGNGKVLGLLCSYKYRLSDGKSVSTLYSWEENNGIWTTREAIHNVNYNIQDCFSSSYAFSYDGCKVAIGSIYYNERRGRAYVFEYTNTGIVLIGDYYSDDVNPNTNYGWCVHVDQDNICTIHSCSLTESDEYDFKDTFKL